MKLHLITLREGRNLLSESILPERLDLDGELFQDAVVITGHADWNGDHADIRLKIETKTSVVCDRCAEDYVQAIAADLRVQVLMQNVPEDDDGEQEGLIFAGKQGTHVDLKDEIVEAILINYPLKRLCSEECKGFCPHCYSNLNEGDCEHVGQIEASANVEPRGETIADKLQRKQQQ
ncbi:MAG TPA: DUF177 domain-containing protein [Bacteroidetes bacterium]|nr:hypothetical protein BMS3Bbin04_00730 [bacterium BMS3Bbin04]HDO65297.1 DUF177 domain-containing protein [Bacteroidota bacterium]HEX04422.1 DUF177 domain-containing protein [Bacteroidota bacterium]